MSASKKLKSLQIKLHPKVAEFIHIAVIKKWEKITGLLATDYKDTDIYGNYGSNSLSKKMQEDTNVKAYLDQDLRFDKQTDKIVFNHKQYSDNIKPIRSKKGNPYNNRNNHTIPEHYVNAYIIFSEICQVKDIMKAFRDFINSLEDPLKSAQLELNNQKETSAQKSPNNQENNTDNQPINNLEIPPHFYGIYEGYFIRPKEEAKSGSISRLYLLINTDKHVFMRTTGIENSNKSENNYYDGKIKRNNQDSISLYFNPPQNKKDEFLFVFDISKRKVQTDKYLKGIYAGTNPAFNHMPVAGRMILYQIETIQDPNLVSNIKDKFLTNKKYKPSDLKDEYVVNNLFKRKDINSSRTHFYEFFTQEQRYIEDSNLIEKYKRSSQDLQFYKGDYSIYSLRSKGNRCALLSNHLNSGSFLSNLISFITANKKASVFIGFCCEFS